MTSQAFSHSFSGSSASSFSYPLRAGCMVFLSVALSACGESEQAQSATTSPASTAAVTEPKPQAAAMAGVEENGLMNAVVNGEKVLLRMRHIVNDDGSWEGGGFWQSGAMNSASVSMTGLGGALPRPTGKNDMTLDLTIVNMNSVPTVLDAELIYYPAGLFYQWDSTQSADLKVTLYKVQVDGDMLDIAGSFSGTVIFPESGREPKEGFPRSYSIEKGVFDVKLPKE